MPRSWSFSRYTLAQVDSVTHVLAAMELVRLVARQLAIRAGSETLGFFDGLLLSRPEDLVRDVTYYSAVPEEDVEAILTDMTYGAHNVKPLDPAVQPVIPLNQRTVAVAPLLHLNSSVERNYSVLLNRIPEERKVYSKLVNEKEMEMREEMRRALAGTLYRVETGKILGRRDLPDIDIAILDDEARVGILGELKWFIAPADISETIDRAEELKQGIKQATALSTDARAQGSAVRQTLRIDDSFELYSVVISKNCIGDVASQDALVPVIWSEHLLRSLLSTKDLRRVCEWLTRREYLPVDGEHYEISRLQRRIGRWSFDWYGVKPLIEGAFLPLP